MLTTLSPRNVLDGTDYAHYDGLLPAGRPRIGASLHHGNAWLCPIEEILHGPSIDQADPDLSDEWDYDQEYDYGPAPWSVVLDHKRDDEYYPDVVESLREFGFIRPVTIEISSDRDNRFVYGDGHHRLAAAIDLGWHHVLVQVAGTRVSAIAVDSGDWDRGLPIPLSNFDRHAGTHPGLRRTDD